MQDNVTPDPPAVAEPLGSELLLVRLFRSPVTWLVVLVAAAYAPLFWGKIVRFRDPAHWNYPARAFVRQAILGGQFPHWNPFVGLGVSAWANPLYAVFYPPNWLLLLVPEPLVASALSWQSAVHTFWGALGIFLLAKRFSCRPIACLVAGLAWALSGYTTSMWSAGVLLIAGAWVPWVAVGFLSCAADVVSGGSPQRALPKAIVPLAMALLVGEVFIALMGVGFGLATLFVFFLGHGPSREVASVGENRRPRQQLATMSATLGAAIVIAFMVGAIVIAPARAVLSGTPRAHGLKSAEAERYSLHPSRVLEFVVPNAFGNPLIDYPGRAFAGEAAIGNLPMALCGYLGAATIGLALLAFGRGRRASWVFLGLCVFILLICFGRHTPVHAAWRVVVFPFRYMRYPEKYGVLLVAWVAMLSGLGCERLLAQSEFRAKRLLVFMAALLSVSLLSFVLSDDSLARYVRIGALRASVVVVVLIACVWLRRRGSNLVPPLVVAIVALDLVAVLWQVQPFNSAREMHREPAAVATIRANAADPRLVPRLHTFKEVADSAAKHLDPAAYAELSSASHNIGLWETLRSLSLIPNLGSVFGIATVPGYDAATVEAVDQLWGEGLESRAALLRLLSIEFALLPVKDPTAEDKRSLVYQPLMDPAPGVRLYRVKDILPRAYVAGASAILKDNELFTRLFSPDVLAGDLALVAEGQDAPVISGTMKRAGSCRIEKQDLNHLSAACESEAQGMAVFVEQFAKGWSAMVDGSPVRILRVNHVMRGLPIQAGRHLVEMTFKPPGVHLAGAISVVALLGTLSLALFGARKARSSST